MGSTLVTVFVGTKCILISLHSKLDWFWPLWSWNKNVLTVRINTVPADVLVTWQMYHWTCRINDPLSPTRRLPVSAWCWVMVHVQLCISIVGTLVCVFIDNETREWCHLMHDRRSLELTPLECVSLSMNTQPSVPAFITHANLKCKKYIHLCDEICIWFHLKVGN